MFQLPSEEDAVKCHEYTFFGHKTVNWTQPKHTCNKKKLI